MNAHVHAFVHGHCECGARERPILFSGEMVRALLAGRKTVTRRLLNPRMCLVVDGDEDTGRVVEQSNHDFGALAAEYADCPYGEIGSRLWVRESFNVSGLGWMMKPSEAARIASPDAWRYAATDEGSWTHGWRPGIHMPRAASRLTLEVTGVRVERLHKITDDDARAEGVRPFFESFPMFARDQCLTTGERAEDAEHRAGFAVLWDELNADRANWKSNPLVWRVAFRVLP